MSADQGELFPARRRRAEALDMDLIRVEKDLMKVPLLFVMNSDNKQRKHVEKTPEGTLTLRYIPMGSHEVRVLCALMGMLQGKYRGAPPLSYSSDDISPEAEAVWMDLGEQSRAAGGFVSRQRTSRRQIAEIVTGKKRVGGSDLKRVMESLIKLQSVSIHLEEHDGRREWSMNLLAGYAREDDTINIVLNPRMVKAVSQRVPGLFSMLSMQEGYQLEHEAADLLYRRLSVLMDQGATLAFRESTLISYLWIQEGEPDERALEWQRRSLRVALKELNSIQPSWGVTATETVDGETKYVITRPTAKAAKLAAKLAAKGGRGAKGALAADSEDVTLRPMK